MAGTSSNPANGGGNDKAEAAQQANPKTPTISHGDASDVLSAYFNIFQDHITAASSDGKHSAAWRGPDAALYAPELRVLREHYIPLVWGVGCAAASFLAFRFGGSVRLGRTGGGGFKLSKVGSSGGGGNGAGRRPIGASNDAEAKSQLAGRILSIPVDLSLSLLIGCSASIFLTDPDKLRKDMSELPLVEGRSLVSDDLCEDFAKEYGRRPRSFWDGADAEKQPSLHAIRKFVLNCGKRRAFEEVRRKERGMGPNDPVAVPKPGVPPTIQISETEVDFGGDDGQGGEEQILKEYLFMTGSSDMKDENPR